MNFWLNVSLTIAFMVMMFGAVRGFGGWLIDVYDRGRASVGTE